MHLDCGDDLFVALDAQVGAFVQLLAALDGFRDALSLLAGLCVQRGDLLDHLHDFALRFGERIADLLVHHIDVRLAIPDVGHQCFLPLKKARQLIDTVVFQRRDSDQPLAKLVHAHPCRHLNYCQEQQVRPDDLVAMELNELLLGGK